MRIEELDSLRGLAIIGVLVIHAAVHCESYSNTSPFWDILYGLFCLFGRMAVPAFILISGFFLTRAESDNKKIHKIVGSRVKRILPPYIFWSAIFFILTYPYYQADVVGRHIGIIFLEKLCTGTVSWHLYFIVLLIQYYGLAAIGVFRCGRTRWPELWLLGGLQVCFIAFCYYCAMYRPLDHSLLEKIVYYFTAYRMSAFPMYIGYFLFGRWLGARYDVALDFCVKQRILFWAIGFAGVIFSFVEVFFLRDHGFNQSLLPADWMISTNLFVVGSLGVLLPILQNLKDGQVKAMLKWFAAWSFVIYILHEPFMGYVSDIFHHSLSTLYLWQLWLPTLTILISCLFCWMTFVIVSAVLPKKWLRLIFG